MKNETPGMRLFSCCGAHRRCAHDKRIAVSGRWVNGRHVLLATWLAALSWVTVIADDSAPKVELIAEVRVPAASDDGRSTGNTSAPAGKAPQYVFKRAEAVSQGQEIFYTVRIRNSGNEPIANPQLVQRVPANTRYIAGTATAAGAQAEFSIDGGKEFHGPSALPPPVKSAAGHQVAGYTHIRWTLNSPLPPGAVLFARFRAEFQ